MKIGDTFTAEVTDLTSQGMGVTRHPNGNTVFVQNSWPEEKGTFKIYKTKGRVGFAYPQERSLESQSRRPSPCQHHGFKAHECGGCPWMEFDYSAQLIQKQKRVENAFTRINENGVCAPIIPAPAEFGYRNRAQLKSNGHQLGFMSSQSQHLAPIKSCLVLTQHNQDLLPALCQTLPNEDWKPQRKGQLTTIDIDHSRQAHSVSVNQRLPFQQANDAQNTAMQTWLEEQLAKVAPNKVIELFCGSGNFTRVIAASGAHAIIAVEGVEQAITQLNEKGLANTTAIQADLFSDSAFSELMKNHKDADTLILDPPREGLKVDITPLKKMKKLRHIFYISCDLATLTRDIKNLTELGFKLQTVQPIDQFPQTPHIELMVSLKR